MLGGIDADGITFAAWWAVTVATRQAGRSGGWGSSTPIAVR